MERTHLHRSVPVRRISAYVIEGNKKKAGREGE
jgi:hypothetical protein